MTGLVANVLAAIIVPVPFATLALALRLKARRMTRMGMGYDDVFAIIAWVFAIGYTVDLIVWISSFKLGQRLAPYTDKQVEYYMEKSYLVLWVSELLYAWSIFFAKLAVLYFYRRVFRYSSIRIPIIILMVSCGIWVVIRTFFTIFHCIPVRAYWDQSIKNAKCLVNVGAFYLGTDITHCVMDFLILALPIYEVIRMKLPFGQKIAVVGLFATGSLVGIASVFQIIHSQQYNPADQELPYELALSMAWGNVELHLAVFIGSLALLRPIFRKYVPGLSTGASDPPSHPNSRGARWPVWARETSIGRTDEAAGEGAVNTSQTKWKRFSLRHGFARHEEHGIGGSQVTQSVDSRRSDDQ
ncbi:hypothetical protein VFPPC_00089 [Pochonia chlamydosporia 170]|uniref:Rhodopsin domain-containing protein n=1 Tax=Pochonia chlamydosporia 170 TaxID=1380566 RepID=A0A179G3I7_METCM|nr:hypothetical protein VFPPC_00089 [Pochonia chlamydosporia 170]OAQ72020.1 hypothetical protein VFPPC_00089 [Pochonia chlamydosporia 170]